MGSFDSAVENRKKLILENYKPKEIMLFGSVAKGIFKENNDINFCIIKE